MASSIADLPTFPVPRSDPFEPPREYSRLRQERPVTRVRLEDGAEAWLVTSYAHAREVLGNRRFSSDATRPGFPVPARFRRQAPFGRTVIRMDPPEHARYRRMLNAEFVIQRVEAMRGEIQQIADGLLDDMVAQDVFDQLREYMEGLVAAKRADGADDMLSRLVELERTGDLSPDEVVDTARLLLLAGHVTTANMIGLGVLVLLRHPDQLADLRGDPGLAANAVDEILRHQTLIRGGLRRAATEDVEVGGQLIRAGEGVIVLIEAANRDATLAGDERFDIHRGVRHHLSFGYGFHQCLGQLLARVELQVALGTIARRFPALAIAVPMDQVAIRLDGFLHGVHELPVTW